MQNKQLIQYQLVSDIALVNSIKQAYASFDQGNKTILFIEPYGAVTALLKRGFERHYNIIILTADADLRVVSPAMLERAKLAIKVNTANEDDVMRLVKVLNSVIPIDAVIPGFEYFVPLASCAAHYLRVPGIAKQEVMALRRKDVMRKLLQVANMTSPRYLVLESIEQLEEAISKIGFPAVCKPVDAAGSVNVKKVNSKEEAEEAIQRILQGNDVLWGHSLAKTVLFEQYIEGKEYSLEGIVQDHKVIHLSVTEKMVADEVEFIEIGHIANSPLPAVTKQRMESYVDKVIAVLGADNCPFHAEIRINAQGEPVLMEIAARLAGDKIGDLINLSREINYYDYIFSVYLGETISTEKLASHYAGIRFFYHPEIDYIRAISSVDSVPRTQYEDLAFYYKFNEAIPAFPKPLRRLGHVIVKHDNYIELVTRLEQIDKQIQFHG